MGVFIKNIFFVSIINWSCAVIASDTFLSQWEVFSFVSMEDNIAEAHVFVKSSFSDAQYFLLDIDKVTFEQCLGRYPTGSFSDRYIIGTVSSNGWWHSSFSIGEIDKLYFSKCKFRLQVDVLPAVKLPEISDVFSKRIIMSQPLDLIEKKVKSNYYSPIISVKQQKGMGFAMYLDIIDINNLNVWKRYLKDGIHLQCGVKKLYFILSDFPSNDWKINNFFISLKSKGVAEELENCLMKLPSGQVRRVSVIQALDMGKI